MSITIVVVLSAVVAALVVFILSAVRTHPDPIDTAGEERFFISRIARHPRMLRFLRQRLDRRTAGGLVLTMCLLVTFAVALVVGVVLDMVDNTTGLAALDDGLARWGAEHADSTAVGALTAITHLGDTLVVVTALALAAVTHFARHRVTDVFAFVTAVIVGEKIIVNGLKAIVIRERPQVLHLVDAVGSSFPSGHSGAAAAAWPAVALVLSRTASRKTRALLAALATMIAVAASRALLGVHWLTDVVAGFALGYGWFVIVAVIFGGRAQRLGDPLTAHPIGATSDPR